MDPLRAVSGLRNLQDCRRLLTQYQVLLVLHRPVSHITEGREVSSTRGDNGHYHLPTPVSEY